METLLSKLAEHGVIALLLALAIYAIYKLFEKYEQTQEKRANEGLTYAERMAAAWKIVEAGQAERAELINAIEVLRRSIEQRGKG